jgi:hypothetical protein
MRILVQEVSNWGLWGNDDELGAANLITPAKRKQALALAKEALPNVLKDSVVTRAILFDATRLPGKAQEKMSLQDAPELSWACFFAAMVRSPCSVTLGSGKNGLFA